MRAILKACKEDGLILGAPTCLTYWPRVCAALMRCGYLTPMEAGSVVREFIRRRERANGVSVVRCICWTETDGETLRGILRQMREPEFRTQLRHNVGEIRHLLTLMKKNLVTQLDFLPRYEEMRAEEHAALIQSHQ